MGQAPKRVAGGSYGGGITHFDPYVESLFTNHPDAVFSLNLEGSFLLVNPAMEQLLGYGKEELIGTKFFSLIQPEEVLRKLRRYSKAAKSATLHYELKAVHKTGRILRVKVTTFPMKVQGEVIGVHGIAQDITQDYKSDTLMFESEKLRTVGQLAASIAHEIRNPLTSIKGFVQLIDNTVPQVKKSYIKILLDELARIDMITSELLILGKPQAHEFHNEPLSKLLQDVVNLMTSQAIMNNVDLMTRDLDTLPSVRCVTTQLKQVFINLIRNAIEAMPGGGEIQIIASRPSPKLVLIQVMDEGCGIPKAFLSKIGSPFYTTKENGTGLGLMATMKIIQAHKGTLEISSIEGKGTTIEVYLPVDIRK